jgi:cysteinyl-tRNA synthetase
MASTHSGAHVGAKADGETTHVLSKSEVEALIEQRQMARAKKDFKTADAIRKQLTDGGVILEDSKDGTQKWRYV